MQEKAKACSERDKLSGNLEIYQIQFAELTSKLEGPNYRNVEERYRRKNIEFETTTMAVADLTTYYDAL